MIKIFTDRSRIEQYQRCHRARFLEYHAEGGGIQSSNKPLPLAVGGAVHEGLALLLRRCSEWEIEAPTRPKGWGPGELEATTAHVYEKAEEDAVKEALKDFAQYASRLSLDLSESSAMTSMLPGATKLEEQLAQSLGTTPSEAGLEGLMEKASKARGLFDQYLFEEQSALVEALVRAYARRRLRPLLEQYEVLEVEREGQWLLSDRDNTAFGETMTEIWFMSRPDALLLERESKQLYILSFKTAATWDIRKAKDAERDMQGLSEGVEVEKRLAEWWKRIKTTEAALGPFPENATYNADGETLSPTMFKFLRNLSAPPRLMGIRYEYMLKGDRSLDKDLTQELMMEVRSQNSHLVRAYFNPGMVHGDETWNWSWGFVKEDGSNSKLYWKSWRGVPVWKYMSTKQWIDMLDKSCETIGAENRVPGWSSPAQATGFTREHPLDKIFIPPIVVYRNDDDLRDWMEQTEAQERRIAEDVQKVQSAEDEGEKRHLLNVYFQQTRRACEYPTTCQFSRICFGGDDMRRDPLGSGQYVKRGANHPQEKAGGA